MPVGDVGAGGHGGGRTIPLIARAASYESRTAVIDVAGRYRYGDLLERSGSGAARLLAGAVDLTETRVAFLVPPGCDYAATLWAIWRAGGIAVPLAASHPPAELEHVVDDAGVSVVVAHPDLSDRLAPIAAARGGRLLSTAELFSAEPAALPDVAPERRALIFYTSGTTGRPKGAVHTHAGITAQIESLVEAWGWRDDDHILSVLPLHHVHGVINVLTCALWSGATCEFLPRFDPDATWDRIAAGGLTLFMAVPTIYVKLIACWDRADPERRAAMSAGCRAMRLMVSGSAALPVSVLERWREIGGHVLLERYGMTEIGMALSNPLDGARVPGAVGAALPGVEVRLTGEDGRTVRPGEPGEIEVRGPGVFREYWNRREETGQAFRDGWFRTGDVAVVERGVYRILGRSSVDIIKTGGYKVSALEIEEVLRAHPDVADCAVVGIPDSEWGERVAAVVVGRGNATCDPAALRAWVAERLAPYKVPSVWKELTDLPRNAMGKVVKPHVAKLLGSD